MIFRTIRLIFTLSLVFNMHSQSKLPYAEIPNSPNNYSAANVAARMIDGLGFRYYWATEGLRSKDLSYQPNHTARSTSETLDHILGLSIVILNSVTHVNNDPNTTKQLDSFLEKREITLKNFAKASAILKNSTDLSSFSMVFKKSETTKVFPFWNVINGPIADALWHVGQVVSFRRTSGNPFPKGVHVLTGKVKQ